MDVRSFSKMALNDMTGSPGNWNHKLDANGLNDLLVEYLKALTDVCKIGIQLAGKLDKQLQSKSVATFRASLSPQVQLVDRKNMSHIGTIYSTILTKMAPLWKQTIFENSDESSFDDSSLNHQQYMRVESLGTSLVELHQSMIHAGRQLVNSQQASEKPLLTRKLSPYIVVTDTEARLGMSNKLLPSSNFVKTNTPNNMSTTMLKSHVPSDEDMNNIIDFLSLTHTPVNTVQQSQPLLMKSSSGSNKCKKQPLGAQRSSPLPGTAQQLADQQINLANSVKHHSDWQLYTNAQKLEQQTKPSGYQTNLQQHQRSAGDVTGVYNSPHLQLPFSNWSMGKNKDLNIWLPNSTVSSGDESHSNTEQLFGNQSLDLAMLVNHTRRSSYDSIASSQAFDTSSHQTNNRTSALNTAATIHHSDSWSCLTSTSSNLWSSNTEGVNAAAAAAVFSTYATESIWAPTENLDSANNIKSNSQRNNIPYASMKNYKEISAQPNYL